MVIRNLLQPRRDNSGASLILATSKGEMLAAAHQAGAYRLLLPPASLIFVPEANMTGPVVCIQCDKPEDKCSCDKYCCYCQAQYHVHLCIDGMYYCPDCREACEVRLVDSRGQ